MISKSVFDYAENSSYVSNFCSALIQELVVLYHFWYFEETDMFSIPNQNPDKVLSSFKAFCASPSNRDLCTLYGNDVAYFFMLRYLTVRQRSYIINKCLEDSCLHFRFLELYRSETAMRNRICNFPYCGSISRIGYIVVILSMLEEIRHLMGDFPIRVTSCYRNSKVNKLVGGCSRSRHLDFRAIDVTCDDLPSLAKLCESFPFRFVQYNPVSKYVHLDI